MTNVSLKKTEEGRMKINYKLKSALEILISYLESLSNQVIEEMHWAFLHKHDIFPHLHAMHMLTKLRP